MTTFERSQYENPTTGETAIGPGGGRVLGSGGVELRLAEGAVRQGVRLKIALATEEEIAEQFTEEQLEKLLPGTTLGSVLKVESQDSPTFEKEVDVVFPVPDFTKGGGPQPTDPKDAYYYVHKKVESKDAAGNPIVLFQVVDEAEVEGEGADAKVVTASPPYPGFAGPMGGMLSLLLLSWSFDPGLPGKPHVGRIVGKVLRQTWDPNAATPYNPVERAGVSATEADGTPSSGHDGGTIAYSAADGTYALWDVRYLGGTMTIVATVPDTGETREAVAFESLGTDRYKPYPHDARANITFPAVKPPPTPPALEAKAFRVENGQRVGIDGITVTGTPMWFGIQNNTPRSGPVTINGAEVGTEMLAMRGPLTADPSGLQFLADEAYVAAQPGTYTFRTTALRAGAPDLVVSWTFRVIAAGAGGVDTVAGAPRVIAGLTVPNADATGVPVTGFLEVSFSEPVRNIPGNVMLEDADGTEVPVRISGVRSGPSPVVVDPLTSAEDVVTSLTIQPLTSLEYSTRYKLKLRSGIVDLDEPEAQALQPAEAQCTPGCPPPPEFSYETSFTTFGPATLTKPGEGETFTSPGMAVIGNRAYLAQNYFVSGTLVGFKVENPTSPERLTGAGVGFAPRPVDVAGMAEDTVSGGRLVVVATGSTGKVKPASLLLFDVTSDEQFRWIGVSSVVSSGMDGFIARVALKGGYAYTATMKKGIQVVDLQEAVGALGTQTFEAQVAINTEGRGWGQQAVVQTIGVPKTPEGLDYYLDDIDVADMGGRSLAVVTGAMGIAVADTVAGSFLFPGTWPGTIVSADGQATLGFSYASALGSVSEKDIAAVVGQVNGAGGGRLGLAVVDLTDPAAPVLLGWTELATGGLGPVDVVLKGDQAFVGLQGGSGGRTLVVSLATLNQPRVVGTIEGVGGRLSVSDDLILYGSAYSPFGGNSPVGGIRTAALGPILLVLDKDKNVLPKIKLPKNTESHVAALGLAGGDTIEGVEVSIIEKDGKVRKQTGSIPTTTTVTLARDAATGKYLAPLKIVDKDCALELGHNDFDEQIIKTPCQGDLESGPWTKLKIKLPVSAGGLEHVTDIRAFRLVAIGDSLTQGVQHGVVVHQDQHYSFPAQIASQISKLLAEKYQDKNANVPGPRVVFRQPMIAEPSIGKPPLGKPWRDGSGQEDDLGFPVPGRLNPEVQPVNNLGISGARAVHLYTSKKGNWQPYCVNVGLAPPFCDTGKVPKLVKEKLPVQDQSPVWDSDAPKGVWSYTLLDKGTPVEQAAALDPSLLIVQAGNNDALNAAVGSSLAELTPIDTFREQYDKLIGEVKRATEGRADVIVVTIPDVDTIPHMRSIGQKVGPLPFTLPLPGPVQLFADEAEATSNFEFADLPKEDADTKSCLGKATADGTCLGGPESGAKIGLATIFKGKGRVTQAGVVLLGKKIRLTSDLVLTEAQLNAIREQVRLINEHILKRASENGFVVFDANRLFAERTDPSILSDPTRLNGLFTGTPVPGHPLGRGYGNTLLGWDGVHPNSAGYALAANVTIDALNQALKERDVGLLEKGDTIRRIAAGSKDEEGTITWLLVRRYIDLTRSHLFRDLISKVE